MSETPNQETPTRVCPDCSTQSKTGGDYCPHCGASFVRRRRRRLTRRARIAFFTVLALIVVGGAGAGAAIEIKQDNDAKAERQRKAAQAAQVAQDRKEREEEVERERQRERDAQKALDDIEREGRRDLERALKRAISKDAEERVASGVLDGPILKTLCDPVGGGREDLASRTGKYECIAATEFDDDGTYSGYSFHATINYKDFSYSWGLGQD
jgi:predicted nucleic acid-binding Zn ribbon protein